MWGQYVAINKIWNSEETENFGEKIIVGLFGEFFGWEAWILVIFVSPASNTPPERDSINKCWIELN